MGQIEEAWSGSIPQLLNACARWAQRWRGVVAELNRRTLSSFPSTSEPPYTDFPINGPTGAPALRDETRLLLQCSTPQDNAGTVAIHQ